MARLESTEFLGNQEGETLRGVLVASYAYEFLPLAVEEPIGTYKHMLSLCCAYGWDMVAERIYFGDDIALTGVDNDARLVRKANYKKELHSALTLANASFVLADMKNVEEVVSQIAKPDLIAIRHPGPMRTVEEVQKVFYQTKPWLKYAADTQTSLIVSVYRFQMEAEGRNLLFETAKKLAGEAHVRTLKKKVANYTWRERGGLTTHEPDYYGFRLY